MIKFIGVLLLTFTGIFEETHTTPFPAPPPVIIMGPHYLELSISTIGF